MGVRGSAVRVDLGVAVRVGVRMGVRVRMCYASQCVWECMGVHAVRVHAHVEVCSRSVRWKCSVEECCRSARG